MKRIEESYLFILSYFAFMLSTIHTFQQVRMRLDYGLQPVPGTFGMNVPNTCTIVIIAGKQKLDFQLLSCYRKAITFYIIIDYMDNHKFFT